MAQILTDIQLHLENLAKYTKARMVQTTLNTPDGLLEIPEIKFDHNLRNEEIAKRKELFRAAKHELKHFSKLPSFNKVLQSVKNDFKDLANERENEVSNLKKDLPIKKIKTVNGYYISDHNASIETKWVIAFQTKSIVSQFNNLISQIIDEKNIKYLGSQYDYKLFIEFLTNFLNEISEPNQENQIEKLCNCFKPAVNRPNLGYKHQYVYQISDDDLHVLSLNKIKLKYKEMDAIGKLFLMSVEDRITPLRGFMDLFHSKLFLVKDIDTKGDINYCDFNTKNIRSYKSQFNRKYKKNSP